MDDNIILQAKYMGKIFSKRHLLSRELPNEKAVNRLINFKVAGDLSEVPLNAAASQ
ncbi:MAG: hypothetical protein ABSD49_10280 [Candidatus Bathyarchaeia archaeon]|jgi:hypothetical protein